MDPSHTQQTVDDDVAEVVEWRNSKHQHQQASKCTLSYGGTFNQSLPLWCEFDLCMMKHYHCCLCRLFAISIKKVEEDEEDDEEDKEKANKNTSLRKMSSLRRYKDKKKKNEGLKESQRKMRKRRSKETSQTGDVAEVVSWRDS